MTVQCSSFTHPHLTIIGNVTREYPEGFSFILTVIAKQKLLPPFYTCHWGSTKSGNLKSNPGSKFMLVIIQSFLFYLFSEHRASLTPKLPELSAKGYCIFSEPMKCGGWSSAATARTCLCTFGLLSSKAFTFYSSRAKLLSCPKSSLSLCMSPIWHFSLTSPAVLCGHVYKTQWQDV